MSEDEARSDPVRDRDRRGAEKAAARARMAQQNTWVDLQVQRAIERGDFDDLPGAGKPIRGIGDQHDPEWWVKQLVERERITVLPAVAPAAQGRRRARRPARPACCRGRGAPRGRGLQRPGDAHPVHPVRRAAADHDAARRGGDGGRLARAAGGAASCRPAPRRRRHRGGGGGAAAPEAPSLSRRPRACASG
ncbi:DUF1992 domain-containing protein [Nocardioides sp. TF02-7]|uniref:DnaJ family domain-containing protein n=1 Tax=Nocardioides sp. TF02-7 TaxID=2917724 RepID=UPI001F05C86A|nr:DUF1992 domain-containing protein [Nocardioides sp. TF02-7]UMG94795.1 DUF1992 domain-containing protein [Nocardioides sp. TF02-7]